MRSRYFDAHVDIELFPYDIKKTRAGITSATLRIEAPIGFEGFYVELRAILLCLVWV